jgi:hypothetical protein
MFYYFSEGSGLCLNHARCRLGVESATETVYVLNQLLKSEEQFHHGL